MKTSSTIWLRKPLPSRRPRSIGRWLVSFSSTSHPDFLHRRMYLFIRLNTTLLSKCECVGTIWLEKPLPSQCPRSIGRWLISLKVLLLLTGVDSRNVKTHLRRADAFVDPRVNGGSMLDNAGSGGGEPLNVIISGQSSPEVLTDSGIINFAKAVGFSTECAGIHIGDPQSANLGDGNGPQNQTVELRQDYGDPDVGTCLESLIGGNHFRVFRQNGPLAPTGALFLAVSQEQPVTESHTISPNGYNQGRINFVANATGTRSFGGVTYNSVSEDVTGLLPVGADGINHGIAIDGIVAVITVTAT